jgi:hypothetical protein
MGRVVATDSIGSPTRWMLVFDRSSSLWWANLIPGRYKHVRAFGYVHDCDTYVFYDVQFVGTTLQLARGEHARRLMVEWTADADVLRYDGGSAPLNRAWCLPFLCTTAIAHLIGLPGGTLRPTAFHKQCLRYGATPFGEANGCPAEDPASPRRSDACAADVDGLAAADERPSV